MPFLSLRTVANLRLKSEIARRGLLLENLSRHALRIIADAQSFPGAARAIPESKPRFNLRRRRDSKPRRGGLHGLDRRETGRLCTKCQCGEIRRNDSTWELLCDIRLTVAVDNLCLRGLANLNPVSLIPGNRAGCAARERYESDGDDRAEPHQAPLAQSSPHSNASVN